MFISFLKNLLGNRRMLWDLTKKDLRQRYLGSYLGITWAFIQPLITVLVFWFVFQVGFKSRPVDNFPFILWLIAGMFPWFFFSDAWLGATNSIVANSFLVKKVVFKVALLPMIQIMSALLVHLFFTGLMFVLFALYGYLPTVYALQVVYYELGLICLVFGLSLVTSSLTVFSRDIGQLASVAIQLGFWATPIFWSVNMIPERYAWVIKLNPMFYITDGFRNAMIYHKWFWELGWVNYSFWAITLVIVAFGIFVFKKLRPHFADVL